MSKRSPRRPLRNAGDIPPRAVGWILAGLAVVIFLERLWTYRELVTTDIVVGSAFGRELLRGFSLYTDLWDHKPPGAFLTHAAIQCVTGPGRLSILFLSLLAGWAVLGGLYILLRDFGTNRISALIGCACWAAVSGDLVLEANQPQTEALMNAWLVWAVVLWIRYLRSGRMFSAVVSGLFLFAATFYKPFVALDAVACISASFVWAQRGTRGRVISGAAVGTGIWLACWCLAWGYFSWSGRGMLLKEALVDFNIAYAGNMADNLMKGWMFHRLWPSTSGLGGLFLVSALVGAVAWGSRGFTWTVVLLWAVVKYMEVALPGKFIPHYYQLWLPGFCVLAGWTCHRAAFLRNGARALRIAGAVLLALVFLQEARWYVLDPVEWNSRKYMLDYRGVPEALERIPQYLARGETFYEWSEVSRLYAGVDSRLPCSILFSHPLFTGPLSGKLALKAEAELTRSSPELVVFDRFWFPEGWRRNPVGRLMLDNYRYFTSVGPQQRYWFLCKKGGELEKRLKKDGGGFDAGDSRNPFISEGEGNARKSTQ